MIQYHLNKSLGFPFDALANCFRCLEYHIITESAIASSLAECRCFERFAKMKIGLANATTIQGFDIPTLISISRFIRMPEVNSYVNMQRNLAKAFNSAIR